MEQWLPLTDYATKYKVSVSTLRRRIKADDIKYLFQEGKYFISDKPISMVSKTSPSLGYSQNPLNGNSAYPSSTLSVPVQDQIHQNIVEFSTSERSSSGYDSDFLENLRKNASTKLPQVKNEVGMLNKNKPQFQPAINIEDEYYFKSQKAENLKFEKNITAEFEFVKSESMDVSASSSGLKEFSEKISKIGNNEPILTAANKLLVELKKAYTQILQEKEEQIMTLKEEVSDLKTLVKVLESENLRLKNYNSL